MWLTYGKAPREWLSNGLMKSKWDENRRDQCVTMSGLNPSKLAQAVPYIIVDID